MFIGLINIYKMGVVDGLRIRKNGNISRTETFNTFFFSIMLKCDTFLYEIMCLSYLKYEGALFVYPEIRLNLNLYALS